MVVPPSLENSLIRASGFSPTVSSSGDLTVLTAGTPVSSSIPISYVCSSAGTFTGFVNVVYGTGATDEAGVAILEKVAVLVNVILETDKADTRDESTVDVRIDHYEI